jgi:hypothetical protein
MVVRLLALRQYAGVVGVRPVEVRVVNAHLQSAAAQRVAVGADQVAPGRRALDGVELILLRRPERKAIMVLGRQYGVLSPGRGEEFRPGIRIVPLGRERAGLRHVLVVRHLPAEERPAFAPITGRVNAPVNENPKLRVGEPRLHHDEVSPAVLVNSPS